VSRARGLDLQNALARYLRAWFPHAESAGVGRNGTDVLGTPGITWECKTAANFKADFRPLEWVRQVTANLGQGNLPVVVYWPAGIGEKNAAAALSIIPLGDLMIVLEQAGYAVRTEARDGQ
jgi:hypothetical protein